ncbi:hypothetical protein QJS10_CPA16g00201 [Acorus calamus]|uniref:Uncharacterized protein n=1 Tax=Acorus calamus TaxID=4465 RepID=A0AAV9CZZ7_ACOCL|nr:hypothetical protein QJS10_CPA16g00201 [Acorus calamus]
MASTAAAKLFKGNMKKGFSGLRRVNLEGLRWRVFDAKGQVLGRLASQIATVVQGKDKPTYAPYREDGDMCIVLNAKDKEYNAWVERTIKLLQKIVLREADGWPHVSDIPAPQQFDQ